jgi:hypothetical protein
MENKSLETPILMVIFNRPDKTRVVFEAIRKARPKRLYFAADGPRPHVPSDQEKCRETREIVKEVDWDCEVKTLFRDQNLKCGLAVSSAISWFFEHETEGIILEDDCLPSPSFFPYCQQLLERYRDDSRVMHIGGNNFLNGWKNSDYSYYFSRNGHIWGWATWRRAWKYFDFRISKFEELRDQGLFDRFFISKFEKMYRMRIFERTARNRDHVTYWAYQWDFARWVNSGLAIVPCVNLVTNIGFGEDSTHTSNVRSTDANLKLEDIPMPLKHPPFVMRDMRSDRIYSDSLLKQRVVSRINGLIPFGSK